MPLETTHASGHLDLFGKCFHEEYDSELEDIPRDNEPLKHTIIEYLISENLEVWEEFLNNKFCRAGYTNSDSKFDDKWRYYAKQDYVYLLDYVRFTAYRGFQRPDAIRNATGLERVSQRIGSHLNYAEAWRKSCVGNMGIPDKEMSNVVRSHAIIAYSSWQHLGGLTQDSYSSAVMLIPCLHGWGQIALHLRTKYPNATPNTLFYEHWFKPTMDYIDQGSSDMRELERFLEHFDSKANRKHWSSLFHEACQMEIGFFNSALAQE